MYKLWRIIYNVGMGFRKCNVNEIYKKKPVPLNIEILKYRLNGRVKFK